MSTKEPNSWQEGEEVSSGEVPAESKEQPSSVKRNCGRWWWLYLLLLIIIVVVIVIPIIFVAVKKIAQSVLNESTVNFESQSLTDPGENSFDLTLNSTVIGSQGHGVTVETFNQSFYMLDTLPNPIPFMYANSPAFATSGEQRNVSDVYIDAPNTYIANMSEFGRYASLIAANETFSIGVRGNPHLKIRGLPKYTVTWDKVLTTMGFNGFKGFSVSNLQLYPFIPQSDGATLTGFLNLPNPSKIRAQFGNITASVYSSNTYLGYILLQYVDYQPGNNAVTMRGYVNLTLVQQYTQNNAIALTIKGNSSVNIAGQHLAYFEDAIKNNVINYTLNLTAATASSGSSGQLR